MASPSIADFSPEELMTKSSPSESSDVIFRDGIEEDDELWTQYLQLADEFDTRLVDDLTKMVDTILVFVCFDKYPPES